MTRAADCAAQGGGIFRVKRNKFPAVPVGFKLGGEFFKDVGHVMGGHFQVPFQAAGDGGMGHVGRADIGAGKTRIAPEMICLSVEAGALCIIGYAHLDIGQARKPFYCSCIRGPHIGCCYKADRDIAVP